MPSLPNILTGFKCDGSAGGVIVNGELVIDFTDSEHPLLTDNWPTADWARTVFGVLLAGSSYVRVIGIDMRGKLTGDRFLASPDQSGILLSLWKVKTVVVETPNTGLLYLGFSNAIGIPYPFKVGLTGTSTTTGYLTRVWKDGEDQAVIPNQKNAVITTGPVAPPLITDPCGLFIPDGTLDGVARWEIAYIPDNLTKYSSDAYDGMVANGDIIVYED